MRISVVPHKLISQFLATTSGTLCAMSNYTIMMTTGTGRTTSNRQYQRESNDSSTHAGFVLLALGLFTCAIFFICTTFSYLRKCRLKQSVRETSQRNSTASHDKAVYDITADQRKLYIDSFLKIKPFIKAIVQGDIESHVASEHYNNLPYSQAIDVVDTSTENTSDVSLSIDESIADDTNTTSCAICLEAFKAGDEISSASVISICQHEYHKICITEWLMKCYQCPVCRSNYIPTPASLSLDLSSSPTSTGTNISNATDVDNAVFPSDLLPAISTEEY